TVRVDAPTYVLTQRDFTAKVRLNQVVNFDAASYNVTFNASVLQVANVTAGLIGSTQIPIGGWNQAGSGVVSIVQNVEGTPGISGTGYLAVLHFHVIGANSTSSQIGLTNGILGDKEAQAIPSRWVADSVQVATVLPGDANGDEAVNALDLTATERIIVGLDAATPGADANKDGSVNALDLTLIERIIVGLQ
ncbi:MAG: dockerin type I domain-containing protein, partial [Chloroflexota bacterium]